MRFERLDRHQWHEWFAWYPVVINKKWVWLEDVSRRETSQRTDLVSVMEYGDLDNIDAYNYDFLHVDDRGNEP